MTVDFLKINAETVKQSFPEFYVANKEFFEITQASQPIGFYGVKRINDTVGEISVYIHEPNRKSITRGVATKCLSFPFSLGFKKIMISTKLKSIERFLRKVSCVNVRFLVKYNNFSWFEVTQP